MGGYDSSFLLNLKTLVKEKLKSMNVFIDDELPDYIMVMVANKKSEANMAKDLHLFLGDKTNKFSQWLQEAIKRLLSGNHNSKEVIDKSIKNDKDLSRKRVSNINSHKSSDHQLAEAKDRYNSHTSVAKSLIASREPHEEIDLVSIDPTEDEFLNETSKVNETRKVISTFTKTTSKNHDVKVDDSLASGMRSVVEIKIASDEGAKERSGTVQGTNLLLKRAMDDAKSNDVNFKDTLPAKRKCIKRPIACSDVSSSSQPDSTRFFVTLSDGVRQKGIKKLKSNDYEDQNEIRMNKVLLRDDVLASRLGSRVVTTNPGRVVRLSAKRRLGPINRGQPLDDDDDNDDRDANIQTKFDFAKDENDLDGLVEGDFVHLGYDDDDRDDDVLDQNVIGTKRSIEAKPNLADRLMNFSNSNSMIRIDDHDDNVALFSATHADSKQTNVRMDHDDQTKKLIPSNLERCKFWPNCRSGSNCQYIHPKEQCTSFPYCSLGSACTFIHPPCRYGIYCTRPGCSYTHSKSNSQKLSSNDIVCRFQNNCTKLQCPFYHPPNPPTIIKYPISMKQVKPISTRSIPCRYRDACTNRSTCMFYHPPKMNQLKWVASIKVPNQQDTVGNSSNDDAGEVIKPTGLCVKAV